MMIYFFCTKHHIKIEIIMCKFKVFKIPHIHKIITKTTQKHTHIYSNCIQWQIRDLPQGVRQIRKVL